VVDDDDTEEEMMSPVMWRKPYTVVAAADAAKEPHDRSAAPHLDKTPNE
jgi:hypothetical protein